MQVLIIDNDIAYRNGVSMAASNKHWIPVSCGDIRTAKQIISSTLPDLIISDCLLYGETVIDLLVWMKLQRIDISQLYLIVLVAVFYWGFVLVYHPTNYSGVPVISLYASCVGACAASMFFMGTFCFTATNLMRNIGLAIGLLFFFWLLLTSTIIRVLPEILQLFKLSGEVVQDGYLIPFWPSRILYVVCAVALMYWNLHLVNQQPDFNKKRWCKHGNKSM